MHEMSLAAAVVEQVERTARDAGATAVTRVRLRVGELAGVVPDALAFCFALACAGTLLEGAELVAEPVAARARCPSCAEVWAAGMPPQLWCPACGGSGTELLCGRELQIADASWVCRPERERTHRPSPEER